MMTLNISRFLTLICCATALLPCAALAQADRATTERQRISNERQQVQERYAQRERDCDRHFVVSSCIESARRERRSALDRLHHQQLALDEAQRAARTQARLAEIQAKKDNQDRRRAASGAASASSVGAGVGSLVDTGVFGSSAQPREPASPTASAPRAPSFKGHPTRDPQQAAGTASERARHARERQAAAQSHRDKVAKRNAERASRAKPAASLPVTSNGL